MIRKLGILAFFVATHLVISAQSFSISKFSGSNHSEQGLIYALPKTILNVNIELVKTTLKRGLYAEYAEKFLGIKNVPFGDSETWRIEGIKINPSNEPDPEHYYGLTFKTVPENLQALFSMNEKGVVLEFSNDWKRNYLAISSNAGDVLQDPLFTEDPIQEKVDTLYKTVVTDSTFTRIPVFKKQIQAKTFEEMAKEAAHQLIKTRKRRIKLTRGEFEFHPDGAAVRTMIDEMMKLEQYYLSLFLGIKKEEKLMHTFVVNPSTDLSPQKLGAFSSEKGIIEASSGSAKAISIQFNKENAPATPGVTPDKGQNLLYFRVPAIVKVSLFIDQDERVQTRIPFYQLGSVQSINFKK